MTERVPLPGPVAGPFTPVWTGLDDARVVPVLAELTVLYRELYGPGAAHEMARYPVADFSPPGGGFLVLLDAAGGAAATGGLRRWDAETAEFKRMWVRADLRRRGLARRVLAELEARARAHGYSGVRLTTGSGQQDAARLYVSAGYRAHFDADLLSTRPAEFRELLFTRSLRPGPRSAP